MKKTSSFIIIIILLLTTIIYARDVTQVNWPTSRAIEIEQEEGIECNDEDYTCGGEYLHLLLNSPQPASPPLNASGATIMTKENIILERVILELKGEVTKENLEILKNMGCKVEVHVFNLVQVSAPCNIMEEVKRLHFVKYLRYPSKIDGDSKIVNGPSFFDSEDFSGIYLKEAHKSGYMGEGVKVAIIDTAFDPNYILFKNNIFYTLSFRSTDKDIKKGEESHGNAVAEILTRVAPKAKLILVNFETDVEYIKALKELINKPQDLRPDIILTSVNLILPDDYYDGTGIRGSLASLAKLKGITLVSSAGNNGQTHYKGNFLDSNENGLHNFTSQDDTLEIDLKKDDKLRVVMAWKDNWKSPSHDLDLGVFDDSLNPVKISNINQLSINSPPYEMLEITAPYSGPYHIAVKKGSANCKDVPFMIYVYSMSARNMEYYNPETSLDPGIPPSHDVITVGAVQNQYPYKLEPWSSQGKTTDERIKPDIVALSGVYCTSKEGMFWGTSSAAPQVAGAVAILLSKTPGLTPEEIKIILKKTASDLGNPGDDPVFGSGLINIYKALNY